MILLEPKATQKKVYFVWTFQELCCKTALLLKTIKITNRSEEVIGTVNLVLRLAVEGDNINNKNSIITCIPNKCNVFEHFTDVSKMFKMPKGA